LLLLLLLLLLLQYYCFSSGPSAVLQWLWPTVYSCCYLS
jgi:hypothetical protein